VGPAAVVPGRVRLLRAVALARLDRAAPRRDEGRVVHATTVEGARAGPVGPEMEHHEAVSAAAAPVAVVPGRRAEAGPPPAGPVRPAIGAALRRRPATSDPTAKAGRPNAERAVPARRAAARGLRGAGRVGRQPEGPTAPAAGRGEVTGRRPETATPGAAIEVVDRPPQALVGVPGAIGTVIATRRPSRRRARGAAWPGAAWVRPRASGCRTPAVSGVTRSPTPNASEARVNDHREVPPRRRPRRSHRNGRRRARGWRAPRRSGCSSRRSATRPGVPWRVGRRRVAPGQPPVRPISPRRCASSCRAPWARRAASASSAGSVKRPRRSSTSASATRTGSSRS
jgi:hypothetical protein